MINVGLLLFCTSIILQVLLVCVIFKDISAASLLSIWSVSVSYVSVSIFVILPSTFISGDRYMHQNYQDAISLIQRFGKPHLFVTMTTNPDWDEIQQQLKEGETALDRPDIVARVFKLKKQQFTEMLVFIWFQQF